MRALLPLFLMVSVPAFAAELIAFRGVHANFKGFYLGAEHCTARRIEPLRHNFVENTIASIQEAFRKGAKVVTIDVQPTLESELAKETLVAYSDETLDCRAFVGCGNACKCGKDKKCWVRDQSLQYLKTLDIGNGYTPDGGNTVPLRGKIGEMPSLAEILNTLSLFSDHEIWLNRIDPEGKAGPILLRELKARGPELARRIRMNFGGVPPDDAKALQEMGVRDTSAMADAGERCLFRWVLVGWSGYFPDACKGAEVIVPMNETLDRFFPPLGMFKIRDLVWGWPVNFLLKANKYGLKVIASEVNSTEDLKAAMDLPLAGIMTNRIEEIGPQFKKFSSAELSE